MKEIGKSTMYIIRRSPRSSSRPLLPYFQLLTVFACWNGPSLIDAQRSTDTSMRLCVLPNSAKECDNMRTDVFRRFSQKIDCVIGQHKLDCLHKVADNEADVVNVSPEEAYVGAKRLNLMPILLEKLKTSVGNFKLVAVVPDTLEITSLSELKGKKSCHTHIMNSMGWMWPIAMMTKHDILPAANCSENMNTISNFFSSSCIPGRWVNHEEVDQELKEKYPNLCALCNGGCSSDVDDSLPVLQSPLQCLTNSSADVAFTTHQAAFDYFKKMHPTKQAKFRYLCLDGTTNPLTTPCHWLGRPNNMFVTSSDKNEAFKKHLQTSINTIHARSKGQDLSWMSRALVSSDQVTSLTFLNLNTTSVEDFLGTDFTATLAMPETGGNECDEKSIKICVSSSIEDEKCQDLSSLAYAYGLRPKIGCFFANSHFSCLLAIEDGQADIITLDPSDVFLASRYHKMVPIMAEQYGSSNMSFYAVAVVRTDSQITTLEDLKGKKSCHPGIGTAAGWDVPVGMLIEQGLIEPKDCRYGSALAEFFSGGSCVPGAKDKKYDTFLDNPESLCSLCMGDENSKHKCNKSSSERLYGYSGAFRCLATNQGDVAFVKHSTAVSFTDRNSQVEWAKGLRSADYVILCPNKGTRNVNEYQNCHLASVPGHAVMTSVLKTNLEMVEIVDLLSNVATFFGPKSTVFNIFAPYKGLSDLIFKDSATALLTLTDQDASKFLGDYARWADNLDSKKCLQKDSSSSFEPNFLIFTTSLLSYIILHFISKT